MAHYGTLGEYRFDANVDDLRGAEVYGLEDEKIGKIDDVIFDHNTGSIRYVVIDSGGWLKSRKYVVPADRVYPYDKQSDAFVVGVTKKQIESFPPYDEKHLESQDQWRKYEDQYKRGWHEAPVQHRHGSDRNITPPEEETVGVGSSSSSGGEQINAADLYPDRLADKFSDATPGGQKITEHPRGTADRAAEAAYGTAPLSGRWGAFEEHLRRNRVDIQAKCPQCAPAEDKRDVA